MPNGVEGQIISESVASGV